MFIDYLEPKITKSNKLWAKSLFEMFKQHSAQCTVLIVPSPSQIRIVNGVQIEWTDHETAEFYRKWLESGNDLENYKLHQKEGFPLFN